MSIRSDNHFHNYQNFKELEFPKQKIPEKKIWEKLKRGEDMIAKKFWTNHSIISKKINDFFVESKKSEKEIFFGDLMNFLGISKVSPDFVKLNESGLNIVEGVTLCLNVESYRYWLVFYFKFDIKIFSFDEEKNVNKEDITENESYKKIKNAKISDYLGYQYFNCNCIFNNRF